VKAPRQARGTIRLNFPGWYKCPYCGLPWASVLCESNGGGGGNWTPVRRSSARYDYMLSRRFSLAPRTPDGWISRSYPVWISASSPPAGESAHPTEWRPIQPRGRKPV